MGAKVTIPTEPLPGNAWLEEPDSGHPSTLRLVCLKCLSVKRGLNS